MGNGHLELIIKKGEIKDDDVKLNAYYNVIDNQIYCYFVSLRQHEVTQCQYSRTDLCTYNFKMFLS